MTHTPWTVESCRDTLPGSIEGSRVFADNAPEGDKLIAQCYGSRAVEHAQLIAASPDLLAALEALLGHFAAFTDERRGGWGNQEDAYYCLAKGAQDSWNKARAVVAKAKAHES